MRQLIEKLEGERQDLLKVIAWYRKREYSERGNRCDFSGALTSHMLRLGELEDELTHLRKERAAKRAVVIRSFAHAGSNAPLNSGSV